MKPIKVVVPNCVKAVDGADKATLHQLWMATKDIAGPYRITALPSTGDADSYLITGAN